MRAITAVCGMPAVLLTWALWLAVGLGHLGLHGWIFDLFANFTAQYMALFAVCVVALTIARRPKMAMIALLGVAATTATMAPYFLAPSAADPARDRFRLVTFNLWFRNDDTARAVEFLRASRADVVVLQEVEIPNVEALAQSLPELPHRLVLPTARHALAIFSRWPMREAPHEASTDERQRIARVDLDWRGTRVAFFGAHLNWPLSPLKAAARAEELDELATFARASDGPVLVAGDFNLTPWSRYFERFVARSGLTDCAIGHGLLGTWPAQFKPLRIRIDQCFASAHWRVQRVAVGPALGSDHLPVTVDLALNVANASTTE